MAIIFNGGSSGGAGDRSPAMAAPHSASIGASACRWSFPALTVLGLLSFIGSWNSFLWPLLMLDMPKMFTLTVSLNALRESGLAIDPIYYTAMLAGTMLASMPLVILFLAGQRFFISGIMSGAFKGGAQ